MIGCHIGRFFQVTVAGGSYQEGLASVIQGVPPGLFLTEQEIYGDLLLRKPGADELSSPRKEPDLPIIFTGLNAADTIENANNKNHTNGTPLTILIPNLDRHLEHIKQYQDTNHTPRRATLPMPHLSNTVPTMTQSAPAFFPADTPAQSLPPASSRKKSLKFSASRSSLMSGSWHLSGAPMSRTTKPCNTQSVSNRCEKTSTHSTRKSMLKVE